MARGRPARAEIYQRLDAQVEELWDRLGGLPSRAEAADIWQDIWFAEAHHSTAIEGNTLVLSQVEQLLAEGRAVGDKQLTEYMEVRGYADASEWVYAQAVENDGHIADDDVINLTAVRRIHQAAMTPVWDVEPHPDATPRETAGSFREHNIARFTSGFAAPPWQQVPSLMDDWIAETNTIRRRTVAFPEEIAKAHCRFEQIHPFLDGNGRTGRLVLNLILVRLGYSPAIIYKGERDRYLKALRRADGGDYGALGEFIARAILDNLYRFVVPAVAGPARLVPIAALASGEITAGALRTAAVRGVLQATKGADGQWRSSKDWVDEYVANRHRRR